MKRLRKFFAVVRRKKLDAEMAEEMRGHLERRVEANLAAGMSMEEARDAARRQFGGVEQLKEIAREGRGWTEMEMLGREMTRALRSFGKTPGFTAIALLTLALGIGVNTAMFSVLNTLLFHQPPYPEPAALLRVARTGPMFGGDAHSPAAYYDFQSRNKSFVQLSAFARENFALAETGRPAERVQGMVVSGNFFAALGVQPTLGRSFTADDDAPGRNNVVVLSDTLWRRRFNADPAIINQTIRLGGEAVTVIGVMPPGFDDPFLWGSSALWRPLGFNAAMRQSRTENWLGALGRLQPGVSEAQAQAELDALAANLAQTFPETNARSGVALSPLARSAQDSTERTLSWFAMGLAACILLIACANLANLLFARHAARARDQAIRSALGASRGRLMMGVLLESLLLAGVGGALGLLVALGCNHAFAQRFLLAGVTSVSVALDFHVLVFALVAAVFTGLAFGVGPAWFSSRPAPNVSLQQGGRGVTASRVQRRFRSALIAAEVALALMLLTSAGFFLRGLERSLQRELGWQPEGLFAGTVGLRGPNYTTIEQRAAFFEKLSERLAALPGVDRVAVGSGLPTWGFAEGRTFFIEGRPAPAPGSAPSTSFADISLGYFNTLGLQLIAGRDFNADDRAGTRSVAIVNESIAHAFWPGESPLGKRLGWDNDWREIVGVVRDAGASDTLLHRARRFQLYRPVTQAPNFYMFALRTKLPPDTLGEDVRRAIAAIDPEQPLFDAGAVRSQIDRRLANLRLVSEMLAAFALLGLVLAAVGLYGVISHSVAQRTHEVGIRMALGAQVRDVLKLVLGEGLRLTLLGSIAGLVGAVGVARLLVSVMPGLPPAEPVIAIMLSGVLLLVALAACWFPARRAAQTDPVTALRAE